MYPTTGNRGDNPFAKAMEAYTNMQFNQMNITSQQQAPNNVLNEIQQATSQLSQDEIGVLYQTEEFIRAKAIYENNFMEFLSSKYAMEFTGTNIGLQSAQNLLQVIKVKTTEIQKAIQEEKNRLAELSRYLAENPGLLEALRNNQINEAEQATQQQVAQQQIMQQQAMQQPTQQVTQQQSKQKQNLQ